MKFLALVTFLPPTIHAACYTPPKPHISNKEVVYPQKRTEQVDLPPHDLTANHDSSLPLDDPTTGPSPISIDLPPQFLPPPWSPYSELDSPYPSGGVSPWDDSGRAQMIDNEPSYYNMCPRIHLDCRKCPLDPRCTPWLNGGVASSTPLAPEDNGQTNCPIQKCDRGDIFNGICGRNARCTRGFCVCDLGWKGSLRHGVGFRGNEGLGALTVYNDPEVDCDTKCDSLSCKEVPQLAVGACWNSDGTKYKEGDTESGGSDGEVGSGLGSVIASGAVGQSNNEAVSFTFILAVNVIDSLVAHFLTPTITESSTNAELDRLSNFAAHKPPSMPGLQNSRWAPMSSAATSTPKKNAERHVEVPYFGFVLPPATPAPPKKTEPAAPCPAPTSFSSPASPASPTPVAKQERALAPPTASPTSALSSRAQPIAAPHEPPSPAEAASRKLLSRADMAAAATRARMAEIMGPPRRRLSQSAGAHVYGKPDGDVDMEDRVSPKKAEAEVEKFDVDMMLLD